MDKLLAFLNALPPARQVEFATRCGTTVGYLRKAISIKQQLRERLCIDIERESMRAIVCEDLRPDVDWQYLRSTQAVAGALMAQAPAVPVQPAEQQHVA